MSVGRQGKYTNWPDDTIGQKVLDERHRMWGEMPGKIVSFDKTKGTATVQPLYKPRHNGKPIDMPQLLEVPVQFNRTAEMAITFPIAKDDRVTLRPNMRSSENYHSDDDGTASDARSFSLADMEAYLDGGETAKTPIENFDDQNAHFRFNKQGTYGIRGSKTGKIKIEGSQGNIYALINDAIDECKKGFEKLKVEPALEFKPTYAQVYDNLVEILTKLRDMQLS